MSDENENMVFSPGNLFNEERVPIIAPLFNITKCGNIKNQ